MKQLKVKTTKKKKEKGKILLMSGPKSQVGNRKGRIWSGI